MVRPWPLRDAMEHLGESSASPRWSDRRLAPSSGEFVRGYVTAEGFFSMIRRGIVGTPHHVGKGHLGKYVSEFEFRYNARKVADKDRPVVDRRWRGVQQAAPQEKM